MGFQIGGCDRISNKIWILGGSTKFAQWNDPLIPPAWIPNNNSISFNVTSHEVNVEASLTSPVMGMNGYFVRETDRTIYYSSLNSPYIGIFNMGNQAQIDPYIALPNDDMGQYCAAINADDETYFIIASGSPFNHFISTKYSDGYMYQFGGETWTMIYITIKYCQSMSSLYCCG